MFFRPEVYDGAQVRSFDINSLAKDALLGDAYTMADALGQTISVVSGFAATSTNTLSITLAGGRLYSLQQTDPTSIASGSLPADTTLILKQAWAAAQTIILTTSALSTGQSQYALIQAGYSQTDVIAPNDPSNGLLNFYNASNPNQPFVGPAGDGLTVPTERSENAIVQVIYSTPATTGSQTPPNATFGYVPLYLINLAYGQSGVSQGQILTAGPSVGTNVPSNYPYAPFLAGLLNSHHSGTTGQAPQINLATETQGILQYSKVQGAFQFDLASPPSPDQALLVGQRASITFENVTTVPFHISTSSGLYEATIAVYSNSSSDSNLSLLPNNTTYSAAFNSWVIEVFDENITGFGSATTPAAFAAITGGSVSGFVGSLPVVSYDGDLGAGPGGTPQNSFFLDLFGGPSGSDTVNDRGPFIIKIIICTNPNAKMIMYQGGITGGPASGYGLWNDTTTTWTSLGTLTITNLSSTISGFASVQRLA